MNSKYSNYNPRFSWTKEQAEVNSDTDLIIEEMQRDGYSIIPNYLASDEVELIRSKIEEIYQHQVNECGGEENLEKIGDQHTTHPFQNVLPMITNFFHLLVPSLLCQV